jgi:serine/threonine-protein kinase
MSHQLAETQRIFDRAVTLAVSDRREFLRRACRGDASLLADVETLLQEHDARTSRFEAAIGPVAARVLAPRAEDERLEPGSMLGPYRIEGKISQGGMGVVYRAHDTRLDRDVAVKVVARAVAGTADARARLLREAKSAAALSHPNIATLFDCGQTGESPWLVMEYVVGTSLRSRLRAGPLDPRALSNYAMQIAAALEHAHARQIVHRDIKPENILVTDDETIKVIDFGLAKRVSRDRPAQDAITADATFVGTLAYSAPELFSGGSATARGDIYSFGVTLYELACGEQPFGNPSSLRLIAAILAGDYVAVESRNAGLPPGLCALIARCMSRDPSDRFRDGAELLIALRRAAMGEPVQEEAPAPPRLAVLDFVSIAAPGDMEWLGTALAETLSAELARIKSITVATRARVLQAARRIGDPMQAPSAAIALGKELTCRWILTGGYQQIGERIRVTPHVIDAATGNVLSIEKIDGHRDDVFDLQDRVVSALLKALTIGFDSEDRKIVPAETRNMLAYEHYVRGRQHAYRMDGKSLGVAIHHFEQAVELDADYALAYAGLGTAHALHFLHTSDPDDARRASLHLERAIELDADLGEPYPWLTHARIRRNDPAGALAAARKGVELQPDLFLAHYFLGSMQYMIAECRLTDPREGLPSLAESIRLEPRYQASWVQLGALTMFVGGHDAAIPVLLEAIRMERDPDATTMYRFLGGETLLGIALMRSAQWEAARARLLASLDALKSVDHVYRDTFRTLSLCALGDVELRCGGADPALAHLRHARRLVKEAPRTAGSARLLIRASTGLAAAYAAAGNRARARELVDEAQAQLESVSAQIATTTFECGLAQLHLGLAVAELRLGRVDDAAAHLARAREKGWSDRAWILNDPELRPLHDHDTFVRVVREMDAEPPPEMPLPESPRVLS